MTDARRILEQANEQLRDDEPKPETTSPRVCELCGAPNASRGLVRWRDPMPGQLFSAIWRCTDKAACQARVKAAGEQWPLDDRAAAAGNKEPPASEPTGGMDGLEGAPG